MAPPANLIGKPLHVLIVEDSEADAELLLGELAQAGYDVTYERVQTASAMQAALERSRWDIVVSDYSMPAFSGPAALGVLQQMGCDLPFIIVSGTIGEETAVSSLKAGAHDFLVKGRLARLAPAIERELRDVAARQERQQLAEQLRQSQKMEAIGQLAGGIAHDFNNLLTAILGFSELVLSEMDADSRSRPDVLEIQQAGQRAAGLTRQLLAFSRKQILQPKILDVNGLIGAMEPMLKRLIFENIELAVSLAPDIGSIEIDATQLEQILVNLVVNARDAMPRGGKLTIETAAITLDAIDSGRRLQVSAGDYIMVSVTDSGVGIDDATKNRMFEPFFTTKGVGKGTGLGLSTVYGIVKQSGGDIAVTSEPGHGTMFRIYLPLVTDRVPSQSEEPMAAGELATGSETVLVVEDDPAVRLLARATLQRSGYQVLEASNPQEAAVIASEYTEPIDLLLTDVIMPESQGAPLVDRLRIARPGIRVLYMSGYADDTIVHHGVLDEGTPFLPKPFTPRALVQKVRSVLTQRAR